MFNTFLIAILLLAIDIITAIHGVEFKDANQNPYVVNFRELM
ncbi:hypothetical protein [Belliella alkalica]|nr:hypothetical protein [Belliella alkalica]